MPSRSTGCSPLVACTIIVTAAVQQVPAGRGCARATQQSMLQDGCCTAAAIAAVMEASRLWEGLRMASADADGSGPFEFLERHNARSNLAHRARQGHKSL